MKLRIAPLLPALLFFGGLTLHVAQTGAQEPADQLSPRQALGLMRTFNTAQAQAKFKTGRYDSLEGLLKAGYLSPKQLAASDDSTAAVKNYKLALVVSADGLHYQVSLRPAQACGYSLFSSEAAVIYEGYGLGCAKSSN